MRKYLRYQLYRWLAQSERQDVEQGKIPQYLLRLDSDKMNTIITTIQYHIESSSHPEPHSFDVYDSLRKKWYTEKEIRDMMK